jgi:lysophospholipase L1-like esterase
VVSTDARGGRQLVRQPRLARLASALVLAGLVAACSTGRERVLPSDRTAEVRYVALGDSTVEGIGASSRETNYVSRLHDRLRAVYPKATVTNLGAGGATSSDVVAGQLERALELGPSLVTVSIGPNDITSRLSVTQYERNLDTIFKRLTRESGAVVVANLLPDLAVTPRFRRSPAREVVGQLTVAFNEALGRKASEYRVLVVDLYKPSRDEVPRFPELIAADGYHPSDVGYARWSELLWQAVEPRIAVP